MTRESLIDSLRPRNPDFLRTFAREAERRGVKVKLEAKGLYEIADELDRLREERESIHREAAKLVLLAIGRSDEFWQEQLQYAFDLTVAEAKRLADA